MEDSKDLQNIVLGILAPEDTTKEKTEGKTLLQITEIHHEEAEVLSRSREVVSLIEEALRENTVEKEMILQSVSELAATINRTILGHYRQLYPGYELSLLLLDYLRQKIELEEVTHWITAYADKLELRIITRDNRRRIAYLEDYWGDQTSKHLAEILQTKKPTVQRWLDGNNPSSGNTDKMNQIITILFRLHKRAGMKESEALEWFNSHNGILDDSPRNIIKNGSHWGIRNDLQKELKRIGAYD